MQQEVAYVKALGNAASYRMIEGRLEIQSPSGETILVFAGDREQAFQADPGDLVDTEWVLTLLNNKGLVEGTNITLTFAAGQIGGFAGCNAYGGGYTATRQGTLTINEVEVTAQGCVEPDGVMQQENTYIAALTRAKGFRVMEDRLEIEDAAGGSNLAFARKAEHPMNPDELVGTAWQLVSWNGDRSLADSIFTLVFHDDKEIAGHAGCRGYVASYKASGDSLRFPFLGMTGSFDRCSETLLLQEGEYTTSLEWVTNYRLREGQLELLTARGEILLFESLPEDAKTSLEGTTWVLTAFTEEEMVEGMSVPVLMITDLLEGTEISATFENGTMSGSAGCNSYNAAYSFDGSLITFETSVTTEIGCIDPPGVMEQEQRFLSLLKGTGGFRIDGNQLRIETDAGWTLVFAGGE
jgi:heat shock protein HslJ